eukprot:12494911-Ditylum_brightwellii.AAC.1
MHGPKKRPVAHVKERITRGCAQQRQKGSTLSKKPVPVKKCKKGRWSRFGEGVKIPVPEEGNGGGLEENQDEDKLKESLYYTPTVSSI